LASRAGLGALCLSLVLVGLIDSAALTPIAAVAAGLGDVSTGVRAGLAVVGRAASRRRPSCWGCRGSAQRPGPLPARPVARASYDLYRDSTRAWAIVSAPGSSGAPLYVLSGALGVGHSLPLTALRLGLGCRGGAARPGRGRHAGRRRRRGAAAAGVPTSQAVAFGLAAQALVVLAGAAVVVLAGAWEVRLRLVAARS
jgi:hypothetical protein